MQEWLAASKILPDSYSGPEHSQDEDADGLTLSPGEQQQAHASCGSEKPPKSFKIIAIKRHGGLPRQQLN